MIAHGQHSVSNTLLLSFLIDTALILGSEACLWQSGGIFDLSCTSIILLTPTAGIVVNKLPHKVKMTTLTSILSCGH